MLDVFLLAADFFAAVFLTADFFAADFFAAAFVAADFLAVDFLAAAFFAVAFFAVLTAVSVDSFITSAAARVDSTAFFWAVDAASCMASAPWMPAAVALARLSN